MGPRLPSAECPSPDCEEHCRRVVGIAAADLAYVTNKDGAILSANAAMAKVFGCRHEELAGRQFEDLFPPELVHRTWPTIREYLERHDLLVFEHSLQKQDGGEILCETRLAPVRESSGQVLEIAGVTRDLGGETRTVGVQSESILRATIEHMSDGMLVISEGNRISHYNPRFLEIWSIPPEVMAAKDDQEMLNHVLPQLTEPEKFMLQTKGICRTTDRSEETLCFKDGRIVEQRSYPLRLHGQEVARVWLFRDDTERKRAEEALRREQVFTDAVLNSVPGLLYLYDDQGHLIRWNKKHEEVTGYSAEELAHMSLLDWYKDAPEDIARINAGVQKAIQEGYAEEEANLQTKDGARIRFHFTAVRLHIDNKVYFAGIGIDITARKRAEERLERNLREAQVRLAVSQALAGKETEEEVLDVLVQQAGLYSEARVDIATLQGTGKEVVATWRRVDPSQDAAPTSVPVGTRLEASRFSMIGFVANGQSFISDDVLADKRLDPATKDLYRQIGAVSVAVLPLMVGSECLGIFAVSATTRDFFDEEKHSLYRTIAEQGAAAIRAARLREKTRESEQRLSLFVQQSPLAAIEWNKNFEIVSWNSAAEKIFGYSSEEALGRHGKDLILLKTDIPQIDHVWHNLLAQQGGTRNINQNVTKDGHIVTCEWFNAPLISADGEVRGVASLVEDVTDRMRSEEALRESEEKYRTLFDSANDCIHLIDGDRWVECNSRGLAMYGCSSLDEMIGTTPADFSPPTQPDGRDSLEKAREVIDAARNGQPQRFYWKHKRKDGSLIDVDVSLNRLVHGGKVYVLAIERDITERKRAEEALRASEAFLDSIIEHSPYSTWVSDDKGTLIRLNQVCRDTLHITNQDVVGKYNVFEDKSVQDQGLVPLIKRVFERGETVRFTMQYDSSPLQHREVKQATNLTLDLTISPVLDAHNQTINAIVQHIDITERKRAEEALQASERRLRSIIEEAPFGAHSYELQPDGRLIFAGGNRSADRILSLDHSVLIGKTIQEAFPGLDSTPIPELYRKVALGGEAVVTERAHYEKNQIRGVFEIHAFHTGSQRMTAFFQDITERKKAEMALRSSLDEKEALLKEVHHRVKNNLQIVSSLLRLQAGREQRESVKAALRDMQSRVAAMALLHEALYRSPNLARVDFGPYVENLCAQLARTYLRSSKPVQMEVRISDVHLDLERAVPCGLIISELVTNAYKHAFPANRAGKILVAAHRLNDDEVELSVSDDGVGLPPNFDPTHINSLGVQLVFRLTGQLSGRLHVDEGPGAGLRIRFPIKPKSSPTSHVSNGDQTEW